MHRYVFVVCMRACMHVCVCINVYTCTLYVHIQTCFECLMFGFLRMRSISSLTRVTLNYQGRLFHCTYVQYCAADGGSDWLTSIASIR